MMNTDGYGVYIEHADEVNINYGASDGLYNSMMYVSSDPVSMSTNSWSMSCSTAIPMGNWWGTPGSVVIKEPKPTVKIHWCQWCGSEFYPHPYYQGNCVNCGGPKHWEKDYR